MEGAKESPKRQRTCIGCGTASQKSSLLRLVRDQDGSVSVDPSGRLSGRGAYVCSLECFEKAARSSRIQRALKTKIDNEQATSIARQVSVALGNAKA